MKTANTTLHNNSLNLHPLYPIIKSQLAAKLTRSNRNNRSRNSNWIQAKIIRDCDYECAIKMMMYTNKVFTLIRNVINVLINIDIF